MPELPEVETVVRTLRPHIKDFFFESAELLRPSTLHPLSLPLARLKGMRIGGVRRRAKLALLDLEPTAGGQAACFLVIHLRMTGRIFTAKANQELGRHTRCVFTLANSGGEKQRLFFDDTRAFGKIMLATPQILDQWDFWRLLGPEPLTLGAEEFHKCLKGGRAIKTCLLDQKVIAGIGNIYADEALFQAGIAPGRGAGTLSHAESGRLLAAIQNVLKLSIAQCGSSIRDYRDANGNVGSFQNSFLAYGRGGLPCVRCGAELQKCRIGGRATVFCKNCQN